MKNFFKSSVLFLFLFFALTVNSQQTRYVLFNTDSGDGSLREAVERAEDGDTILFVPELEDDTIVLASEILLDSISLVIDGGENNITISGDSICRIFNIQLLTSDILTIKNLTFTKGFAYSGGGILISVSDGDSIHFVNCNFKNNVSENNSAAIRQSIASDSDLRTVFSNCTFIENYCESNSVGSFFNADFYSCSFIGNISKFSMMSTSGTGGVKNFINNSTFFYNQTLEINAFSALVMAKETRFYNTVFAGNQLGSNIVFYFDVDNSTMGNCVITDNTALEDQEHIRIQGGAICNTIVYDNINFNEVSDYTRTRYKNCALAEDPDFGNENTIIQENPFKGSNNGKGPDNKWGTDDDDLSLNLIHGGGYDCINNGYSGYVPIWLETDLLGQARIVDKSVDIGAIEYQEVLITSAVLTEDNNQFKIFPNPCRGDVNIQMEDVFLGESATIHIVAVNGIVVYDKEIVVESNTHQLKLDLPSGLYFLQLKTKKSLGYKPINIQ